MNRIRKDDNVKVIAGNHKGKMGRVIKILKVKNRAVVEGVNLAKKHMKPSQENPQGGIIEKELSIHISNLMLVSKGKPVKVGFHFDKNGKKTRVNRKNGESVD
mgnify:CR=1 FL=1